MLNEYLGVNLEMLTFTLGLNQTKVQMYKVHDDFEMFFSTPGVEKDTI